MPSIQEAIKKYQSLLAAGKGTPVSPEPVLPPNLPAPLGIGQLGPSRGTFTPGQILGTDVAKHNIIGAPERSRMFPIPSTPPVNKTVQNVTNTTVQESAPLELEVNGVKNPEQTVLNLVQGSGMQITVDGAGGVHFVSLAAGDGLIHGETPWESDPSFIGWRDDFQFHKANATSAGNPSAVGEIGWTLVSNSGVQNAFISSGVPPYLGTFGWSNTTTAGLATTTSACGELGINALNSVAGNYGAALALLDSTGWQYEFVFWFDALFNTGSTAPSFLKKTFYMGLTGDLMSAQVGGRPHYFVGIRFDKDTTAPSINDSTFHFEVVNNQASVSTYARNNTQGTVVDSGITPTPNVQYKLIIQCTSLHQITMTLTGSDGTSASSGAMTMPQISFTNTNGAITSNNGNATLNFPNTSTVFFNQMANGSSLTIGNSVHATGTWTSRGSNSPTAAVFNVTNLTSFTDSNAFTVKFYPGLRPFITYGNDTEAAPVVNLSFTLDFVSFIWNPGVGGGTATPSSAKPRYF